MNNRPSFFKTFSSRSSNLVLVILLTTDLLFILLHAYAVLAGLGPSGHAMLYVDTDGGYAEYFQYLKFTLLTLGCLYLIFKKNYRYIPWCLLFTGMLLDDAFQYHETIGEWIAVQFDFKPWLGLRAEDWGELCYAGAFGAIIFSFFVIFYVKGSQHFKNRCKDLGLLFLILIFFGVGVDMLHSLALDNAGLYKIVSLLEDGGEMAAVSLMLWYLVFIIGKDNKNRAYLFKYLTQ